MVVENVRGAQKWVGRARWNFGSFYLWGDVPALMPIRFNASKVSGFRFDGSGKSFQTALIEQTGVKAPGMNWSDQAKRGQDFTRLAGRHAKEGTKGVGAPYNPVTGKTAHGMVRWTNPNEGIKQGGSGRERFTDALNERRKAATAEGRKVGKDWFGGYGGGFRWDSSPMRRNSSRSNARKAASALIAKIPLPLSRHIAAMYFPRVSATNQNGRVRLVEESQGG